MKKKKEERSPRCLMVLKTDVGVAVVSPEGAAVVPTPGDAQRAVLVVARAVARAKGQAEKDNRLSKLYRWPPGSVNFI